MQRPASNTEWFLGLAFLAVAMATHFFLGVDALVRVVGIACVLTGLYWAFTRRIPVGWEGRPPSFHLTGPAAVISGILMVAFGLLLLFFAPVAACLVGWSESSSC